MKVFAHMFIAGLALSVSSATGFALDSNGNPVLRHAQASARQTELTFDPFAVVRSFGMVGAPRGTNREEFSLDIVAVVRTLMPMKNSAPQPANEVALDKP